MGNNFNWKCTVSSNAWSCSLEIMRALEIVSEEYYLYLRSTKHALDLLHVCEDVKSKQAVDCIWISHNLTRLA